MACVSVAKSAVKKKVEIAKRTQFSLQASINQADMQQSKLP
jgi:hypothetical protein